MLADAFSATGANRILENTLQRPGGRLAFDVAGEGPLIIAAPSMGDLRQEYRFLTPLLIEAGYQVATIDNRGQGGSDARWNDYSARASGDDILALAVHLGVERFSIIGTSFTAGAALWAARQAPDHVASMIMIGPQIRDYPMPIWQKAALAIGFAGKWRVKFWMSYWDSLFPLKKPADHEAYKAALAANLEEPGRMEALKTMLHLSKRETAALIDDAHPPAMIILGSKDKDFPDPRREGEALAARLNAYLLLVQGAGHYPQVEAPDLVAARIVDFLGGSLPAVWSRF